METETSPHLLVMDDHREIRELLGKYLKQHDFRVSLADGGVTMKKRLREQAIDLVVLDIMMLGEDRLSLCRSLRENTKLPVIMLTAMAEATDRVIGLEINQWRWVKTIP
ncbi:Signal transduction response regulator, receiver region domain protein [Candidatus Thiomargarita nelsonii]|uniref:Signal transduction response regulator, receiver region domain protein n=1 Tax=Candidatus Thiomargarita nelsonii TaxID=1003181 RepID=A0A176RV32_9GAMM|nr:Signal transduction response regulator, receiver region domain protein [Candidatus Thiomargarita nelsonii]